MRKTTTGGSPTSFLTCSSGWDAAVICEAVALPSLLNTPPSLDTLKKMAAAQLAARGQDAVSSVGLGISVLCDSEHPQETTPCKPRIAVATTVYLNSLPTDVPVQHTSSTLQTSPDDRYRYNLPSDLDLSPTYTPKTSPFTASPASDVSSITSSVYEDPFHWDLVLSGLPETPDLSLSGSIFMPLGQSPTFLPTTKSSPLLPQPSISSLLHHTSAQEEELSSSSSEPGLSTASSGSSVSDEIPTIVVINPEFVSIPVQASISSIVGMYGSVPTGETHFTAVKDALSLASIEEEEAATEADAEGEDEWWSDTDGDGDDETEFEIVAVPALRTRLETICEEDRIESNGETADRKHMVRFFWFFRVSSSC